MACVYVHVLVCMDSRASDCACSPNLTPGCILILQQLTPICIAAVPVHRRLVLQILHRHLPCTLHTCTQICTQMHTIHIAHNAQIHVRKSATKNPHLEQTWQVVQLEQQKTFKRFATWSLWLGWTSSHSLVDALSIAGSWSCLRISVFCQLWSTFKRSVALRHQTRWSATNTL